MSNYPDELCKCPWNLYLFLPYYILSNSFKNSAAYKYKQRIVCPDFDLFGSHARDLHGMPDPNGTAVVMKFKNILNLEQYFYSVSAYSSDQCERCHVNCWMKQNGSYSTRNPGLACI